jgi:acyl dehydratase
MVGMYWEDWEIGKEYVSPSRTITEADIVHFAGISGDYNPLHINEEHCKKTIFWNKNCPWASRIFNRRWFAFQLHLYDDTLIAFLGFDSLKFTRHVIAGDTITAKIIVTEKRETSKTDRGVMKRSLKVFNQNDEMVQDAIQAFLLKRKP